MAEEIINPTLEEAPESESVEQFDEGGIGQKRLGAVLNILKTDFPERYGNVDEKWLSNFINQSPENAGRVRKALMATGRIKNLPENDADFVNMLKDTGPVPAKPVEAVQPQPTEQPQETTETPQQQSVAPPAPTPAPAPVNPPVPGQMPAPEPEPAPTPIQPEQTGKKEEPGFFEKAWQGLGMMALPNLQTAQTVKNVWDRITGKTEVKKDKSSTKEAKALQQYERNIGLFREIDDKKRKYEESRKQTIEKETGFGDFGERSAAAGRALSGLTRQEKEIPVSPESKKMLEEHELKRQQFNASVQSAKSVVEKLADEAVKKNGADKFFQYNPGTGHTGYDISKVDETAKTIAAEMGVPTDGYAYSLIKNRIQGIADFEKNVKPELEKRQPEIEKRIAKEYGKIKTLKDSRTGKVTAANLQEEIKADFTKKFTEAEVIKAKNKAQQTALLGTINAEAKSEAGPLKDAYAKEFETIQSKAFNDPEVINFQQELENKDFQRLQDMVNGGQLTVEKANEILKNPERQKKISEETTQFALKKYGAEFGKAWDNYTQAVNAVNSRKQAKFIRMRDEIVASANDEIQSALEKFKGKYKMDPSIATLVQTISKDVYEKEIDNIVQGKERAKFQQDQANSFVSNVIDQTISNLGSSLKNFGIIFGSDGLRGFGDVIENNYKLANYKNDSWTDLFDATKMAGNTGMLLGRMAPGIAAAAGVTAATRGAGLGQAAQILGATFASWGAETADMLGGMYDQVLAKTGDPIKAKDATNELFAGQVLMIPTYTIEVLPFFNVMKGSAGVKALKAGSLEYFTEGVLQEFPQNAMEEVIANNDKFYNAYKAMNYEKFKETMVATAPSFFMGGAPAAFKGVRDYTAKAMAEREAKSFLAKQSLLFNDVNMGQTFIDIQREKGKNFTGALVSNMMTSGQLTKEQADALAIQVENFEKFKEFSKKNGLTPLQEKVSFVLYNQLEQAEKDGRTEDANRYKTLFNNLFTQKGAAPDLFAVSLPNGDEYFYTYEQAAKLFESDNFKKMLKDGSIAFGAWYNDKANPQLGEIEKLYNDAIKEKKPTDEEVLVDDEEYARFKNENKVDEERMLAFIDDYLNNVDFSKIPNIDQRYVEMYNHFLPEIKKRAGEIEDETFDYPEIAAFEKERKEQLNNPFGNGTPEETIAALNKYGVTKPAGTLEEFNKQIEDAINAYYDAKIAEFRAGKQKEAETAAQKPIPTVGQVVIVGGEKGTVIDEGGGKLAIETPTKTIEIPEGKTLEDLGAKLYTEPTQAQGKTAAERLRSKLQQRKDRAKMKVQVIDENTAIVGGKEFRINKDPKGNAIYLTDGKIEIRDENVLIDVDIQRHKLEVKETPEEQERQLQELYSELPPNRRTSVQAIMEKDMTDRIANLLENGITDQTDDTDFLQTRLWAEGRIAELREKESDNAYALDMIEELQNLLNTLWYEHYQKFGREPGAESAGKVEQKDTGEKKTPGVQDTGKERIEAKVGDEIHDAVAEFGEGVESKMDAEKRLADGEILFGIQEMDESLTELFLEDLGAWPSDQIIAIRPEYLPGAKEEEAGKEKEVAEEKETEWSKMDAALEATGKQGEKMRADLRAELGDEKFAAMRKITKDFEKIVARLENDNKIKKDCP